MNFMLCNEEKIFNCDALRFLNYVRENENIVNAWKFLAVSLVPETCLNTRGELGVSSCLSL